MTVRDFDLQLARAITEQIVEQFGLMASSALTDEAIAAAKASPGVYQLFVDDELVYIGKTDKSLKGRLTRHLKSVTGRRNIRPDQVAFKALHLHKNWSALTTEQALISHYERPLWNTSGFGSNDPGRQREHTKVTPGSYDILYPVDPHHPVKVDPGTYNIADLLARLKQALPYTFRYGSEGLPNAEVVVDNQKTAAELLQLIASQIGTDWQVTVLPNRIILYKESENRYPSATILWPTSSEPESTT